MTELVFKNSSYSKRFAPELHPNQAPMRVLEKCGYTLEGILQRELNKKGQYYGICRYAKFPKASMTFLR